MFKVIIAGGRDFSDYKLLRQKCDELLKNKVDVEIVSGTAPGADTLGIQYARERGYPLTKFPAQWQKDLDKRPKNEVVWPKGGKPYWKKAGYVRNEQMSVYADALILFWDGSSPGSQSMLNLANRRGLAVRIIYY